MPVQVLDFAPISRIDEPGEVLPPFKSLSPSVKLFELDAIGRYKNAKRGAMAHMMWGPRFETWWQKTFLIQFLSTPRYFFSYYSEDLLQSDKWIKSYN